MKRAIGYVRVSKDRDNEKLSPHAQEDTITTYCQFKGWELVDIVTDIDFTGKNFNRPGWHSVMERVDDYDVIVVTELTRFGRSLTECLSIAEYLNGIEKDIVSTREDFDTTTSAGKLMQRMLLVLAEFERDRLSERLREAHGKIARNGTKRGGPLPLGYVYDSDSNVVIDEREAALVRHIYDLRVDGHGTARIASILNDEGYTTKKGKTFSHGTIHAIIRTYPYVCKRQHNGEVYDLDIPRIIDDETWAKVRAMDGKPAPTGRGRHLLSGIIRCSGCGDTMSYDGKNGDLYRCHDANKTCVHSCAILAKIVEPYVTEQFFEHIDSGRYMATLKKAAKKVKVRGKQVDVLKRKLDTLKVRQARLFDDRYGEGSTMTADEFNRYNEGLQDEMAVLLEDIAGLEEAAPVDRLKGLGDIRQDWKLLDTVTRRDILARVIEQVTVNPGRGSGRLEISWRD